MSFCAYCVELLSFNGMKKHCEKIHHLPCSSLKVGEEPSDPLYSNWSDWIEDPANVEPERIPAALLNPEIHPKSITDQ